MRVQLLKNYNYAVELIKTGSMLVRDVVLRKTDLYDTCRYITCYCLIKTKHGYLPLNRDYVPLGFHDKEYHDYDNYPFLCIPEDLIDFSLFDQKSENRFYFFTDKTHPRNKLLKHRYYDFVKEVFKEKKF